MVQDFENGAPGVQSHVVIAKKYRTFFCTLVNGITVRSDIDTLKFSCTVWLKRQLLTKTNQIHTISGPVSCNYTRTIDFSLQSVFKMYLL